jgi:hypothetical protein
MQYNTTTLCFSASQIGQLHLILAFSALFFNFKQPKVVRIGEKFFPHPVYHDFLSKMIFPSPDGRGQGDGFCAARSIFGKKPGQLLILDAIALQARRLVSACGRIIPYN